MPYPIRKRSTFRSRRIRFLRSLKVYSRRAFYVLCLFCLCSVFLYMGSNYFRSRVLKEVESYSEKFGYVVKEVEVQSKNSSEYCIKLNEQNLLLKYKQRSTILFSANDLKEEIDSIDCVDKISIRKIFPFKIKLVVSYKVPMAIWQADKMFYFITTSGDVIKIRNNKNLSQFVLITGSGAHDRAMSLIKFLSEDKEIFSKISTAAWIGDRRWNIKFNNGTKLMLPENSPKEAWDKFVKLQQTHKDFKRWKYKTVDFRVINKIYAQ